MSTISFTIADATRDALIDAFCNVASNFNISVPPYQATLPDGTPNPQSQGEYAMQCVTDFCKLVLHERTVQLTDVSLRAARNAAIQGAIDALDTTVTTAVS